MRLYDLVLILKSNLNESKRKQALESIKGLLKGAKITKEEEWGQKVLSYPIKKEESGYYVAISLESQNAIPMDFEQKLIHNESVLRHLLIRSK